MSNVLGEVPDHVQAALDASCAALIALRTASVEMAGGGDRLLVPRESERQAMELVRDAIRELRRVIGEHTGSPLALGFVRPDEAFSPAAPDDQLRSRRIA
jgi:hypothetical protein